MLFPFGRIEVQFRDPMQLSSISEVVIGDERLVGIPHNDNGLRDVDDRSDNEAPENENQDRQRRSLTRSMLACFLTSYMLSYSTSTSEYFVM